MSDWRDELSRRLEPLCLRPEREAEIVEELSQHLDDRVRELVLGGETADAARATALADLDEPDALIRRLAAIEARSPYRLPPPGAPSRGRWFTALWQDVRYSIRSLRRTPAFTLTVVAAFALTIGPTTAILSVGNWLLWRPIPGVVEPDRLGVVWFGQWFDGGGVSPTWFSEPNLRDLERSSSSVASFAGWQELTVSLTVEGLPVRYVGSAHASVNFFDVMGVRPIAGRGLTPDDDRPPLGAPVAVVSHGLARRAFGGPAEALGRPIVVNGRRLSVIGVLPPEFRGATPYSDVDVWFPRSTYYYVHHMSEASREDRDPRADGSFYTFVARLTDAGTFDALQAELDVLVPALAEQHPETNAGLKAVAARVFPGLGVRELQRAQFRSLVANLIVIGAVLVLLGCINVTNLLIARRAARRGEHAVRLALGASRARLVQQILAEGALLAVAGTVVGLVAAVWVKKLIEILMLSSLAAPGSVVSVPIDGRVLGWSLGLAVVCGLGAGLVSTGGGRFRGRGLGPGASTGGRTSAGGGRLRMVLAATQLALSLALVSNAFLMVGTIRRLAAIDLGFHPPGVTLHSVDLGSHGYDVNRALRYGRDWLGRVAADPSVQAASLLSSYPFGPGRILRVADPHGGADAAFRVYANGVTEDYFLALGIAIVRGRGFEATEVLARGPRDGRPTVLDARLAARLFGDQDPLGRRVRVVESRQPHDLVVVGVADAVPWRNLVGEQDHGLYVPFTYEVGPNATRPMLAVRSSRAAEDVTAIAGAAAQALDPTLPVRDTELLTRVVADQTSEPRLFASVLSLLGALGFLLAAVGLYGLLAQMVGERTREFGIRMAIGADRAHVFGLVLRQAAWIAVSGAAAGLLLGATGSRIVASQLYGISRFEPWVYGASAASLVIVVALAALRPARMATRIEPVEALRAE